MQVFDWSVWMSHVAFWTTVIAWYQSLRSDRSIWKILLCDFLFVVGSEVYYWTTICAKGFVWRNNGCPKYHLIHSNGAIRNLDGNEADLFKRTSQKPGFKRGWPFKRTNQKAEADGTLELDVTSCKCHSRRQFPLKLSRFDQSQPFWWNLTNNCLSRGRGGAFFLFLVAFWLERPGFYQDGEWWWRFMSQRTSKILVPFQIAKHSLQAG